MKTDLFEGDIQQGFKSADKLILRHGVSDPSKLIRLLQKEVPNLTAGDIKDILSTRKYQYYLDPTTTQKIISKLSRMPPKTKVAAAISVLVTAGLMINAAYDSAKSAIDSISDTYDSAKTKIKSLAGLGSDDEQTILQPVTEKKLAQFKRIADQLQQQYPNDPHTVEYVKLYNKLLENQ